MDILKRQTVREILELSEHPSQDEVRANYKRLVKLYHPDINKAPEAAEYMKRLNIAYEIAIGKRAIPQQPPPPPPPPRRTVIITMQYGFGFGGGGSYYQWSTTANSTMGGTETY